MLTPEKAVLDAILICVGGALLTLLVSRAKTVAGWLAFLITAVSAGLIFYAGAEVLASGPGTPAQFAVLPKFGLAVRLYVDGLTAWFLMLAALIAVPAALYSIRYMQHYQEYGVGRYYPNFLIFVAAIYGLVSTTDMMWVFCFFWQMMTWPSYALIRFENTNPANVRAAKKYLLMMQIACGAAMAGAALLAGSGDLRYDFDSVSQNVPGLLQAQPGLAALAFTLFLAGFGIKMGMWPFGQMWLPDAHPAAPSPVSAMLSGVMIKTGVYGLIRSFLWLVPVGAQRDFPLANWGLVIAVLGTITLFTGTMQALKQEQTKRLLAFHSIGQIGYILLGVGACMALLPAGGPGALIGAIGFFGALFHVLNHGVFKGLLFLNAGSMLYATGTQDLNKMGGLMKWMPVTAITALVASFSISGVPLFNGFASKWSIFVAAVQGGGSAKYLPLCGLIAILTSALTLASFMKFFGASFLARSSKLVTEQAARKGKLEVGPLMQAPQIVLAAICLLLGIFPGVAFWMLGLVLQSSQQGFGAALAQAAPLSASPWAGLNVLQSSAVFMPLVLLGVLALLFLLASRLVKLGRAQLRTADPWLCGYAQHSEENRYAAHGYYGEIKRYFRWLGGMPAKTQILQKATKGTKMENVIRET